MACLCFGAWALWFLGYPDQALARRVTTELARVRDDVELFDDLQQQVSDLETLAELAREEGQRGQGGIRRNATCSISIHAIAPPPLSERE